MLQNILETNQLNKKYGKEYAIKDVSIHVRHGEIYALIGKNGAGKTTIMRMMMGLAKPTSGELSIYGETEPKKVNESRQHMGFMMNSSFYPYLTAHQNVEYFRQLKGIADRNEVDRVLKLVDLDQETKVFRSYSMGMKTRLSIAVALLGSPDIVVLDEPINGLDPQGIADFREYIQRLNKEQHVTFIISSHILGELDLIATRYGFMHDGLLLEEIDREDLRNKTENRTIIKVDRLEEATYILEQHLHVEDYRINGDKEIVLSHYTRGVDELNDQLIAGGLTIYKLVNQSSTLEEYYLELVKLRGVNKDD
ncbi:ABC transporter ATP-binding protein [Aliicoccus persicus]|uniref:ABC-2 type transport system ATP-binding protein n=1 Tax=Aliicoccus persicus TaxID=930138 RepID=A0A662Z5I5_9STAP|nr:ABC transporter ATP-binding protein [Aliicoccus persicus]SEW01720.1 ABC-2 type transport system ATP-binding protein [Aliicoccus persicus]